MKPIVNTNWDAGSSIYSILKEINQLIVKQEPIIIAQLVKKHKASGTFSLILRQRNYLQKSDKGTKIFTWTVHEGKNLPLSELELHKYAAILGDDTRELKNKSRLKVANEKRRAEQLSKAYQALENKRVVKAGTRVITTTGSPKTPTVIDYPKISLDALLSLKTFDFPTITQVSLFGTEYSNIVKVEIDTCDFAEYLHITLTSHNLQQTRITNFLAEGFYKMIETNQIGFGLHYIK